MTPTATVDFCFTHQALEGSFSWEAPICVVGWTQRLKDVPRCEIAAVEVHRRGSGVWVGQVPCDNCDGTGNFGHDPSGCSCGVDGAGSVDMKCPVRCSSCGGSGTVWPEWARTDAFQSWSGSRILDDIEIGTRVALCWILDSVYALMEAQEGDSTK